MPNRNSTSSKSHSRTQKRSKEYARSIDHEQIKEWIEEQGGCPSHVTRTAHTKNAEDPGILRIDFPGFSGKQSLEPISWDEFFEKFEQAKLALIFDESGKTRFNKLVSRKYLGKDESKTSKSDSRKLRVVGSTRSSRNEKKMETPLNVYDILKQDHREVEALFEKILSSKGDRSELFNQLKTNLDAHAEAEEALFYPILAEGSEREAMVAEVEHQLVKNLLQELENEIDDDREESSNERWLAKCQVLSEMVQHHVEEEESELFVKAHQLLSPEQEFLLGAMVEEEELMQKSSMA